MNQTNSFKKLKLVIIIQLIVAFSWKLAGADSHCWRRRNKRAERLSYWSGLPWSTRVSIQQFWW